MSLSEHWTEALRLIESTPLDQLPAELLRELDNKVFDWRGGHSGYVPSSIYPHLVGMGAVYPAVEVIPCLLDADGSIKGYYLKMRETQDQGWQGEYHIPGTGARIFDGIAEPFQRLAGEIFGTKDAVLLAGAQPLGVEIHTEYDERHAACWTLVYQLDLREGHAELDGQWRLFAPDELADPSIVGHHRATLRWASDPNRPFFVDLRE